MDLYLYLIPRAIAIGILISAPMGPIGMLVIQRTLSKGKWPAFFTGIGAGLSDLIYCLLTGFCLSFITEFVDTNQSFLQIIGGVVLMAFGLYLIQKNPTRRLQPSKVTVSSLWSDTVSGFLLTFSNPLIIFFILGLYSQLGPLLPEYTFHHLLIFYSLIFGGALLWWYFVTTIVNMLRKRFNVRSLWLINRIIGIVLMGMGVISIWVAIKGWK